MIIWGSRGITSTIAEGKFHCPGCAAEQGYLKKRIRRFFTLYFIPLFPLETLGEHVECQACKVAYKESVLQHDPRAAQLAVEADYRSAVRQVMVHMTRADDVGRDREIACIRDVYPKITGNPLPEREFTEELATGRKGALDKTLLERVAPRLTEKGKERIVYAAVLVGVADGSLNAEEHAFLAEVAAALGVTAVHLRGIIAEATPA